MAHAPQIVLIAAVARNGTIGRGNELIFRDSADQRHFRAATMGCPVIMGRATWESLPPRSRPLPGRRNIVLSRNPAFRAEGAEVAAALNAALELLHDVPRVFVVGGARVYAEALPLAQVLMLTEVDAELDGDTSFPAWDHRQFDEVERRSHRSAAGVRFDFVTYRRRLPGAPAP